MRRLRPMRATAKGSSYRTLTAGTNQTFRRRAYGKTKGRKHVRFRPGRTKVLPRETADKRATRPGILPLKIQPVALEGGQFRERGRCLRIRQGWIISLLIAAGVVVTA